jgi:hypothetical protein
VSIGGTGASASVVLRSPTTLSSTLDLSTTAGTVSTQLGYTASLNTTSATVLATALGTYTVYSGGTGATLNQLTTGVYLFCVNGSICLNSATGSANAFSVQITNNTTNAVGGVSTFATLLAPPVGYTTTSLTGVYPYSANQVVTIPSAKNNQWFGFSGSFTITSAYTFGSIRMLIDSYSITRIG